MARKNMFRFVKKFKAFWALSASVIIVLLCLAVVQLNDYIHQNTLARNYQKQIAALTNETQSLEVALSGANSLENFDKYITAQAGNFEKVRVETIKYIKAPGGQFARK